MVDNQDLIDTQMFAISVAESKCLCCVHITFDDFVNKIHSYTNDSGVGAMA